MLPFCKLPLCVSSHIHQNLYLSEQHLKVGLRIIRNNKLIEIGFGEKLKKGHRIEVEGGVARYRGSLPPPGKSKQTLYCFSYLSVVEEVWHLALNESYK